MPPQNRLAPPTSNSLAYNVPIPLEPGMLPPPPSRFVPRRELENFSAGLGQGITSSLKGTKQMLTEPVATAQALIEAARQIGADPRIVLDMLRAARQKAMSGSFGLGELIGENITPGMRGRRIPAMRELDVYHGTPHRFPATEANPLGEFDASKIGTGEGAQAYGHGIYYAESPSVAESYARMDSPFAKSGLKGQAATVAALAKQDAPGGPSNAAKYLADNYDSQVKRYGKADVDAAIASLQSGTLYKADLPDEMIDRMLDWDKPLSEQPKMVRDAINAIVEAEELYKGKYAPRFLEKDATAGDIVNVLENALGGPKVASSYLRDAGIPGIKYKDAGSRGQPGTGTRNFVVFPGEEKKVRILERK